MLLFAFLNTRLLRAPRGQKQVHPSALHHRVGVAFPEGLKLLPFYENLAKRQLLPFYAHSLLPPFTLLRPFGHFYRLTQHTNFSSACCACEKGGAGAEKSPKSPNGPVDVKEEGAVERGRENRLARATKSSFDHAVKSFNMVDAFGLLSSSAVHDFVTEDGSICMPRIATNCNTAVVPRSTRDRGVAALAS